MKLTTGGTGSKPRKEKSRDEKVWKEVFQKDEPMCVYNKRVLFPYEKRKV